jgi:cysteine synthase A
MQFENASNLEVHRRTTAQEVLRDFPEGLDATITGVGTGGHITALGELLPRGVAEPQDLRVEPEKSPVISGGSHTPHRLQGIGAGFIPGNLHREVLDGVVQVSEEEAFEMARRCAREEGIFVGPVERGVARGGGQDAPRAARREPGADRSATTRRPLPERRGAVRAGEAGARGAGARAPPPPRARRSRRQST